MRTFGFVWWTKVCKDVVGRPSSALFEHTLSWNTSCPVRTVMEDWLAEFSKYSALWETRAQVNLECILDKL